MSNFTISETIHSSFFLTPLLLRLEYANRPPYKFLWKSCYYDVYYDNVGERAEGKSLQYSTVIDTSEQDFILI